VPGLHFGETITVRFYCTEDELDRVFLWAPRVFEVCALPSLSFLSSFNVELDCRQGAVFQKNNGSGIKWWDDEMFPMLVLNSSRRISEDSIGGKLIPLSVRAINEGILHHAVTGHTPSETDAANLSIVYQIFRSEGQHPNGFNAWCPCIFGLGIAGRLRIWVGAVLLAPQGPHTAHRKDGGISANPWLLAGVKGALHSRELVEEKTGKSRTFQCIDPQLGLDTDRIYARV
jgi:hypothetical protein